MKEKLTTIINQAKTENIRLLIEVELSGKMYIWCDKPNKRKVLGFIRSNGITGKLEWIITNGNIRYEKPQEVRYLEKEKGKIARRF